MKKNLLQPRTKSIKNIRVHVQYFSADLSQKNEVLKFADWLLKKKIQIDIFINNAGQFVPGNIYNEPEGNLEKMMNINLFSAYHLTRALLPQMMKKKSGHIFNICSIAALKAYNNGGSYSISKYALMGFSKNLREEMKPFHIKVTTVYPAQFILLPGKALIFCRKELWKLRILQI